MANPCFVERVALTKKGVTIRQIAREANVSPTTVSRVINNDYSSVAKSTRERILEIVARYDYRPGERKQAQADVLQKLAGVVLPNFEPFFIDVAVKLGDVLHELGFEILIRWSRDDFAVEQDNIERILEAGVQGILYMSTTASPKDCYAMLNERHIPYVVLDSYLQEHNVPAAVCVDGARGMYDITNYLIENGHRDIAYISGISYDTFNHNRYLGYSKALLDAGIAVDPKVIKFGSFTFNSGRECMRVLLEGKRAFTAVVCENDIIAAGALDAMKELGVTVPDEISITGFDNSLVAEITTPKLTSVEQPLRDIARKAVELLIAQVNNQEIENRIIAYAPRIVVRNSVINLASKPTSRKEK